MGKIFNLTLKKPMIETPEIRKWLDFMTDVIESELDKELLSLLVQKTYPPETIKDEILRIKKQTLELKNTDFSGEDEDVSDS